MERTLKDTYSVATDDVTGRLVIIRCNREVIGALSREESIAFAQNIIDWIPQAMRSAPKADEPVIING